MGTLPIKTEKHTMVIAIETTCPSDRIVAFILDAIPRWQIFTELMIALVFGDEKSAYPKPRTIRLMIIIERGVRGVRKIKNESPSVVIAIPAVATIWGSTRSESFPATGEKII